MHSAYYGCYQIAKYILGFVRTPRIYIPKKGSHQVVMDEIIKHVYYEDEDLANELEKEWMRLYHRRCESDYDNSFQDPEVIRKYLGFAKKWHARLKEIYLS